MKRLEISSRTGHFNLFNPSEEQVSCRIAIFEDGKYLMGTSFHLEYEENPSLPTVELAIEMLDECFKKMWIDTSREEKQKLLDYLKENQEEIDEGTIAYRIEKLTEQRNKIDREIKSLLPTKDNIKELEKKI